MRELGGDPPALDGQASNEGEYRSALAEYTPARVTELSGVSGEDLAHLADLFGDRKLKITSLWCMGRNQHTRGTAINNLVHGIHLLSGHFGGTGDAPTGLTGQPSACGTVREVGTLAYALPSGMVVANPRTAPRPMEPAARADQRQAVYARRCRPRRHPGALGAR